MLAGWLGEASGGEGSPTKLVLKERGCWGIWMAPSVKHQTLDFGSGHDLTVCGIKACIGFRADRAEPAWDSLSPSLPAPHYCHTPQKINKINLERKKERNKERKKESVQGNLGKLQRVTAYHTWEKTLMKEAASQLAWHNPGKVWTREYGGNE